MPLLFHYYNSTLKRQLVLIALCAVVVAIHAPVFAQFSPYDPSTAQFKNQLGVADTITEKILAQRQAIRAGYDAQAQEVAIDPTTYVLGPGDGVYLDIFTLRSMDQDLTVTPEGRLIIPQTGTLTVSGLTIAEAETKVNELLRKSYKKPDATLSLRRLRSIKISVIGDVLAPGVFTVTAASRVHEAIERAGGFVGKSSLRNVEIRDQQGKLRAKADMQRFLAVGDLDANPVIEGGDVVLVPRVRSYITINGAVSEPGMKEFVAGDKLSTVIKISRGLRPDALLDSIEISRFLPDDPSRAVRQYVSLTDDPELHEGDAIQIRARSQYHIPKLVAINGEVRHPGKYAIEPGVTRLSEILKRAGGILPTGSLDDAVVLRRAGVTWESDPEYIMLDRLVGDKENPLTDDQYNYYIARTRQLGRSVMIVNFRSLIEKGDASQDIIMRDNDSIAVPRSRGFISVLGNVTNPGNIMYDEHASWDDYVRFAGGYTSSADEDEVRIINSKTSTYIDPRGDNTYKIGPGDTIVVPSEKNEFWKNFQNVTAITAQVLTIVAGILLLTR